MTRTFLSKQIWSETMWKLTRKRKKVLALPGDVHARIKELFKNT